MAEFERLTEGCIASILSHTKPIDACRLSLVSKTFRSAANSDTVWNKFLQSDTPFMDYVLSHSPSLANFPTKKALYMSLCDRPIIIDHGRKSFHFDRKNGRKCFMLAVKSLNFFRSFNKKYIEWTSMPNSRFPEILKLRKICMLKIHEVINTNNIGLSPNTWYDFYLVFKKTGVWLVEDKPVNFVVSVQRAQHFRENPFKEWQYPRVRRDGWLETKMGMYYNIGIINEVVHMRVLEIIGCNWSSSLSIVGIEVRPYELAIY